MIREESFRLGKFAAPEKSLLDQLMPFSILCKEKLLITFRPGMSKEDRRQND